MGFAISSFTATAFFHVKSALDGINPGTLIHILRDEDLPETISRFYYNLIAHRKVYFMINGSINDPSAP